PMASGAKSIPPIPLHRLSPTSKSPSHPFYDSTSQATQPQDFPRPIYQKMKRRPPMTTDKQLLSLYGLKWNPFISDIPVEAIWSPPQLGSFSMRLESLVMEGGFAMISGEPGLGKSKTLHLMAQRLGKLEDVVVGVMERPQSTINDFYREMSALFGVNLSPANRYGGFKALRERWHNHIRTTLFRPVLLVDEAQEMTTSALNELRLLASTNFDSQSILTTVLCGDD